MITQVTHLTLFVKDHDKALIFYTEKLGFKKHTDVTLENNFRWVTICTKEQPNFEIALMTPMNEAQTALIGKQAPGVPLFCVQSEDCHKTVELLKANGIVFTKEPTEEVWGTEAICKDLYGNMIDIVQPVQ